MITTGKLVLIEEKIELDAYGGGYVKKEPSSINENSHVAYGWIYPNCNKSVSPKRVTFLDRFFEIEEKDNYDNKVLIKYYSENK